MPSPESKTWRDWFQASPDVPEEKLRWWLSDRMECPLTSLPLNKQPTSTDLEAYQQAVSRLRNGEPIQYICGQTPFRNLMLQVSPAVLIPRPETEQLVQIALDQVLQPGDRILDVGTGSGCIALSVKQERPQHHIEATDLSEKALTVARGNAKAHQLEVSFRQADLLAEEPEATWDVILSNPPYIADVEKDTLPRDVREFEPATALFSGSDGLDHIRILLEQARQVLKPNGRILMETGETQGPALQGIARELGYSLKSMEDLAGRERFCLLIPRNLTSRLCS